ncbi:MAG: hypothetical protein MRQ09_06760 [Candidatus Midichloria sp.]|nr:hypothetical protein [Candidatus Midichloria sp.]
MLSICRGFLLIIYSRYSFSYHWRYQVYSKFSTPKDASKVEAFKILVLTDIGLTIGKEVTKYVGNDKFDLMQKL